MISLPVTHQKNTCLLILVAFYFIPVVLKGCNCHFVKIQGDEFVSISLAKLSTGRIKINGPISFCQNNKKQVVQVSGAVD